MRNLFVTIIIVAGLLACNQEIKGKNGVVYKSAVQYNDYIISRQNTLIKNILDLSVIAQTNLDSADKILDKYVVETDSMIIDVNGMPLYKGDSTFRNAAIASFAFYKKTFGNEYKQLISIRKNGGDATEEGVAEMKKIVNDITREEEKYDKAFHNAQKNFADKNNMKLGENEMQKKIDKIKE
ncbi:MAG TPA: hypothetical protein VKC90_02730 [Chitinophagaceae bacterium]|nr:hypothetical protein [Chitinophagaceae bacterium]